MAQFIRINKSNIINADHIIQMYFTKANSGIDEETGKPFSHSAMLVIVTTEQDWEYVHPDSGNEVGNSSKSFTLVGAEAEDAWGYFCANSSSLGYEQI